MFRSLCDALSANIFDTMATLVALETGIAVSVRQRVTMLIRACHSFHDAKTVKMLTTLSKWTIPCGDRRKVSTVKATKGDTLRQGNW